MNKKTWIIITIVILLIGGGIYFLLNTSSNKNISSTNESTQNITANNTDTANQDNTSNNTNATYNTEKTIAANSTDKNIGITPSKETNISETEIANFSTKIYSKDSERQNNINITCSTLNNTDVTPRKNIFFYKYNRSIYF